MEMPKEWNELPEMQRQVINQSEALINQYNWNLDPMQFGDLAALATYGVQEDPFLPEMFDAEIPMWGEPLEPISIFPITTEDITGCSYINL